ncbi:hypothetical protein L915_00883 [Phytophthora nicotianae]|uniref:Uncharacterized protein n=1 Tax=Phytophthora nicotianae TaxID=4792 RepID=W2HP66_PHYNI|nr:hypothetical protein L915_00883 [Phytophthora nicotianae]ETM56037.1 hypothetical protein L914_00874 [Phytophthora nicotianae]
MSKHSQFPSNDEVKKLGAINGVLSHEISNCCVAPMKM